MCKSASDPAHYKIYPIQPIRITRYLNFCLGNAVKYVLRAPFKGGVEDCDKATRYLFWENEAAPLRITIPDYLCVEKSIDALIDYFSSATGDKLWLDVSDCQADFLLALDEYLCGERLIESCFPIVKNLREILSKRDEGAPEYAGMTGLPD